MTTPRLRSSLEEAVIDTLAAAGMQPVAYRWALVVETVEEDGQTRRPLVGDASLSLAAVRQLVVDVAEAIKAHRCVCGGELLDPAVPRLPGLPARWCVMSGLLTGPPPSGAHLAPECDQGDCDGYRTWDTPAGPVEGHCGCPAGGRVAEIDYGDRRGKPPALTPAELLRAAS